MVTWDLGVDVVIDEDAQSWKNKREIKIFYYFYLYPSLFYW